MDKGLESTDSATHDVQERSTALLRGPHHYLQANPNTIETKLPITDLIKGPKREYLKIGVPLYEASIKCDWEDAYAILVKNPELVKYSITENGETALHVAASAKGPKHVEQFVKNLVGLMTKADLETVNKNHNTALYLAAAAGNVETVKIMVKKNKTLLTILGGGGMVPLYAAALFGNHKVVQYLYEQSRGLSDDFWTDKNRGWLLEKCVESDMFDIALDIVKKFPQIGRVSSVLGVLARKPEAFQEKECNIIERTIKSVSAFTHLKMGTPLKMRTPEKESEALQLLRTVWEDIVQMDKNDIDRILRGSPDPITMSDSGRVIHTARLYKYFNKLREETQNITKDENQVSKLKNLVSEHVLDMHVEIQLLIKENKMASGKGNQVLELQQLISDYIVNIHNETKNLIRPDQAQELQELINVRIARMRYAIENPKRKYSSRVLFVAAEVGNTTFLVELIRLYPDLIWKIDDDGLSIFHIAVKNRHAGIYNLLYEIGAMKDMITPMKDTDGNNMLHLVGRIVNRKQLENVSGGALEMQQELLWFQEVQSMIPPAYRDRKNDDDLTPHELFSKEHKDMVTQGEKWIKDIASQCMVVAALIATMVFAAAFTVPGGYDQNNGIPIFYSETTFKVFVIANAISLFSASASILYMFLSVFTSRYAERDFLESVPRKLIIGMSYLFLSMTTMIIAFSISYYVLYKKGLLWIPILVSGFALIPFGIYVKAQYFLFIDIIRSTYRSRYIFKPKKHILYYENPKV